MIFKHKKIERTTSFNISLTLILFLQTFGRFLLKKKKTSPKL